MRVIRQALRRDVPVLRPMLRELLAEHQKRFPGIFPHIDPETGAAHYAIEWARRLEADPTCNVWLAADRDVRGFLAGEVWSRPVGEPPVSFFVEWLYVVPEHRKTGIFRALVRDGLIPYCRRHAIGVIEARTVPGDTQWLERGWNTTAICMARDIDALAADVARE